MTYTIKNVVAQLAEIDAGEANVKRAKLDLIANVSIEKKWTAEALTGEGAGDVFIGKVLAAHHGVDVSAVSRPEKSKWRSIAHPLVRGKIAEIEAAVTPLAGRGDTIRNKIITKLKSGVATVATAHEQVNAEIAAEQAKSDATPEHDKLRKALLTRVNGTKVKECFTEASLSIVVAAINGLEVIVHEAAPVADLSVVESEPVDDDITNILGSLDGNVKAALMALLSK